MKKKWDPVIPEDLKRLFVSGTCMSRWSQKWLRQLTKAWKYEEDGYAFEQTMHDCPHKCSFSYLQR